MAGRNVELGTVGFNLEANDSSLERSLAHLRQFGQAVNSASNATTDAGQRIYRNMVQVERALTGTFDQVSALTDKMSKIGASSESIAKLTTQFDNLTKAMTAAGRNGGVELHEFTRASVGLNAATSQATRAIRAQAEETNYLHAKQTALVNAYEKQANLSERMKRAGATPEELERISAAYNKYAHEVNTSAQNMGALRDAGRGYKQDLGEITRELQASTAASNAAERQQARLIQATRNTAYLNARAVRGNLPRSYTDNNSEALAGLGTALAAGKVNEINSAQKRLNDSLMATRLALISTEAPASRMSIVMHDLSRATVLALGPLSGFGARISVMTALLESNTAAVALGIGAAVGMATALYAVSKAAIQATTVQQQFDAQLVSATGSASLVGKEYQYLLNTANKLGIGIQGLVKPYSDFAASARLSGMTTEQQRKVFEAFTVTGTALRWTTEQQGRAFLALTQMISKTTVQSEEYKKQLGELIPNIIGLGAEAENTSTKGMFKMMKNAELMSNQHLPKLAEMLQKTFGPAAAEGAQTITAQQERLANSIFETSKAFDRATGISSAYHKALIVLTSAVNWLGENMSTVVGILGAFAGAGAGALFARFLMALPGLALAASAAITSFSGAASIASGILSALSLTNVIGWAIRLAAVIGGAAAAFGYFNEKSREALQQSEDISKKVEDWVKLQEGLGKTQESVGKEMKQQTAERLSAISAELAAEQAAYDKRVALLNSKAAKDKEARMGWGKQADKAIRSEDILKGDPILEASKKRTQKLLEEQSKMEDLQERIGKLKLTPPPPVDKDDDKGAKQWEHWSYRITKAIADVADQNAQLEAYTKGGAPAMMVAEALGKAKALMLEMPKKGGNLAGVAEELTKAGYAGKTVEEQLTAMFLAGDKVHAKLARVSEEMTKQKEGAKDILGMWQDLAARQEALDAPKNAGASESAAQARQLQRNLQQLTEDYRALGVEEAAMQEALKAYADEWDRLTGAENHVKEVEKARSALERLNLSVGNTAEKLRKTHEHNVQIITKAVDMGVISQEDGNKMIEASNADMYRKMMENGNEFYKKMHQMLGNLENTIADGIASGMTGGKISFTDTLNSMVREVLAFAVRIAFVKPMLTNLFGGLYTGIGGTGNGLLGDSLLSIGKMFMSGGTSVAADVATTSVVPTYDAASGWTNVLGGRATGGDMNPFASYVVGEDGPEILKMGSQGGSITPLNGAQGLGGSTVNNWQTVNNWHIDSRSDVAQTMQIAAKMSAVTTQRNNRRLQARYG